LSLMADNMTGGQLSWAHGDSGLCENLKCIIGSRARHATSSKSGKYLGS